METNVMAPPHREAYGPEWEKEITNLSKNALAQMIRRKSKELDTLEDQKIQLVGVLKKYGRHIIPTCGVHALDPRPCDCGWEEALKAAREEV